MVTKANDNVPLDTADRRLDWLICQSYSMCDFIDCLTSIEEDHAMSVWILCSLNQHFREVIDQIENYDSDSLEHSTT